MNNLISLSLIGSLISGNLLSITPNDDKIYHLDNIKYYKNNFPDTKVYVLFFIQSSMGKLGHAVEMHVPKNILDLAVGM